jgi:hypothetical protein
MYVFAPVDMENFVHGVLQARQEGSERQRQAIYIQFVAVNAFVLPDSASVVWRTNVRTMQLRWPGVKSYYSTMDKQEGSFGISVLVMKRQLFLSV